MNGVQGVEGSNPFIPTRKQKPQGIYGNVGPFSVFGGSALGIWCCLLLEALDDAAGTRALFPQGANWLSAILPVCRRCDLLSGDTGTYASIRRAIAVGMSWARDRAPVCRAALAMFCTEARGYTHSEKNMMFLLTRHLSSSIYISASGCSAVWERT